jgi:hypothetical protein
MFSPAVFLQVKRFVARGTSAVEIAETIGCKLGTLRVKCSQNGISLENIALDLQKQADKKRVSKADLAVALLDAIARGNQSGGSPPSIDALRKVHLL